MEEVLCIDKKLALRLNKFKLINWLPRNILQNVEHIMKELGIAW